MVSRGSLSSRPLSSVTKCGNSGIASEPAAVAVTDAPAVDDVFDLLPEQVDWRDEGCEIHPSCLNCPLPRCIEEEVRGKQRLKTVLRARRIAQLRRSGKSVKEIADIFGVSQRTVQRALRNQKSKRKRQNDKSMGKCKNQNAK